MNAEHALELRTGWKADEDALLFKIADQARTEGKPLRSVFEEVSAATGRRPNSIRNYYYARIKEDDERVGILGQNISFVPFTEEEIIHLLRTVLQEQAKGISVRACTLAMGNGDNKLMLRYQNKYRSLVKNNPLLVKKIISEMRMEGAEVFDPYREQTPSRRSGRPRKNTEGLIETISCVISNLSKVEGMDVAAFFESLGTLAAGALKGMEVKQMPESVDRSEPDVADTLQLKAQNLELAEKLSVLNRELKLQREEYSVLLGNFRQLMEVNRKFLDMASVTKISCLGDYIRELSESMLNCEHALSQHRN